MLFCMVLVRLIRDVLEFSWIWKGIVVIVGLGMLRIFFMGMLWFDSVMLKSMLFFDECMESIMVYVV